MNGLNQMIAQGGRPIQIESPLNQMAQFEQIRGTQQANMLRQQQMAEMQRQQEQTAGLNRLIQEAFDPATGRIDEKKLVGSMAQGGYGSGIFAAQEQIAKGRKATAEASTASTESALKRIELKRTQLENVSTPDAYVQWSLSSFDDPVLGPILQEIGSTPDKVIQHIQEVGAQPGGLQRLIEESKLGSDKFAQLVKDRAGQAITMRGQDIQAGTTRRGQDITAQTTRRGQDLTERRERDVALAENLAAAKATGAELAKNKVAAQAALPGAIATAAQMLANLDEMIGDAKVSRDGKRWEVPKGGRQPAPGFKGYVGSGFTAGLDVPFMRFVEGSDVAGYERRQLQVEGRAFLEAFESLKGGGAITEIEGAKATQAISRMNKAQSEVEYVKAARELQDIVRKGVERARAKAGGGAAAPAAGGMNPATMSDDELRRALGL
jgi:hypothetical protein